MNNNYESCHSTENSPKKSMVSIGTNTTRTGNLNHRILRQSNSVETDFYDSGSLIDIDPDLKKGRPPVTAFKQQRLPAWEPIFTANTVIPSFFIIGLCLIPIGYGLWEASERLVEIRFPYESCQIDRNACELTFNVSTLIEKPVFVYYELGNFYQNHRRYTGSYDKYQLQGHPNVIDEKACRPFVKNASNYPYAPCGAIANSMFTDVITLKKLNGNQKFDNVPVSNESLAWPTDSNRFKNPPDASLFDRTAKPPLWEKPVKELPGMFENEDLKVWMRVAAFSTFRKLYRRIDHEAEGFQHGLPPGRYQLHIHYNFNVTAFRGRKTIVIANTNWIGGKNPFLGIFYMIVGSLTVVAAFALWIVHLKYGKSESEIVRVRQNTPYW